MGETAGMGGLKGPGDALSGAYFRMGVRTGKLGVHKVKVDKGYCSQLDERFQLLEERIKAASSWGEGVLKDIGSGESGFWVKVKTWWVNRKLKRKYGEGNSVDDFKMARECFFNVKNKLAYAIPSSRRGSKEEEMDIFNPSQGKPSLVRMFSYVADKGALRAGIILSDDNESFSIKEDELGDWEVNLEVCRAIDGEIEGLGADQTKCELMARRTGLENILRSGAQKENKKLKAQLKQVEQDLKILEKKEAGLSVGDQNRLALLRARRDKTIALLPKAFFGRVKELGINARSYSGIRTGNTLSSAYINYQNHCLAAKQRACYEGAEAKIRELQTTVGQIKKLSSYTQIPGFSAAQGALKELRALSSSFNEVDAVGKKIQKLQSAIRGLREIESDKRGIAGRGAEVAKLKGIISRSLEELVGFECRDSAAEEAFLEELEEQGEVEQRLMIFEKRQQRMDELVVGELVKHEKTAKCILGSLHHLIAKRGDLEERRAALSEAYAPFNANGRSKYTELRDRLQSVIDRREALGEDSSEAIRLKEHLDNVRNVVGGRCYRQERLFSAVLQEERLADPDFIEKVDDRLSFDPSALFAPRQESYLSEDMRLNREDFDLDAIEQQINRFEGGVSGAETGVFQAPQEAISVLHGMVERRNKLEQRLLALVQGVDRLQLDAPKIKEHYRALIGVRVPYFKELDSDCLACAAQVGTSITARSREEAEALLERVKLRAKDHDITQLEEVLGDVDLAREMEQMERIIAAEDRRRAGIVAEAGRAVGLFEGRVLPVVRDRIDAAVKLYGGDIEEKFTEASDNVAKLKEFAQMFEIVVRRKPKLDVEGLEKDLLEAKSRFAEWTEEVPGMVREMNRLIALPEPSADEIKLLQELSVRMKTYVLSDELHSNLFEVSRNVLERLLRKGLKNRERSLTPEQKERVDSALGDYGVERLVRGVGTKFKRLFGRKNQSAPGRLEGNPGDLDRLGE